MLIEHQVRLYLYLSTLSAARSQYLYEQVRFGSDELKLWKDLIKRKKNQKNILVPSQQEPIPNWVKWPEGLSYEVWKDFLMRSSRLPVDVLILSFILKKPDMEVAEILDITEGGVLIGLSEGLARLGEHIK